MTASISGFLQYCLGFILIINYLTPTGTWGLPYAFLHSSYWAAIPMFFFMCALNYVNGQYVFEVTSRAQVANDQQFTSSASADEEVLLNRYNNISSPKFEVLNQRKYEVLELCEVFLGRHFKYGLMFTVCIFEFLNNWLASTIAASAWASNIPFRGLGNVEMCGEEAFHGTLLPSDTGCLHAYYISLSVFIVIVVILSILNLKQQTLFQLFMAALFFIAVSLMIIFCVVRLAADGLDACKEVSFGSNMTTEHDHGILQLETVSPIGWLLSLQVFAYSFSCQTALPSLLEPVEQKKHLHRFLFFAFMTVLVVYMAVGIVLSLWFGASTQETITLNWAITLQPQYPLFYRLVSYFVTLYPSLAVLSTYPLSTHIIANNIYFLIMGQDMTREPKYRLDWLFRILLRLIIGFLPALAAFGVANIINIIGYVSPSMYICVFAPSLLQVASIYVCKKKFSMPKSGKKSKAEKAKNAKAVLLLLSSGQNGNPLPVKNQSCSLYWTPYSSRITSHPLFASVALLVGVCLYAISIAGLFINPDKLAC